MKPEPEANINKCCLTLWIGLNASAALAQYSIDWHTMDAGGGTSTGGAYSISGTIGQPDAGKSSGGNYTIEGVCWSIVVAVQTPGAPMLSIALTATNTVVVSWASDSTEFVLQQSSDNIASVNWSNVVITPTDDGATKTVVVDSAQGNRFYRLVRR